MDVGAFLRDITAEPWYQDQIVHVQDLPARESEYGDLERPLEPRLQERLAALGIQRLYRHQADAVNAARRGENVVVATGPASGKSLCYHLPVIEALLHDRSAYALYLFPTKALSQDQSNSLDRLIPHPSTPNPRGDWRGLGVVRHGIFDGDTSPEERSDIRKQCRLLITNPDMLHLGILPNHKTWYKVIRGLRYVVVDEVHVYRGVFGSHVANILRRLRRLCRLFGSQPQFILCSATIANPVEHAERLVGLPFTAVEGDGSPFGGKDFLLWNPPMIDLAKGSRRSTNTDAALVLTELMRRHVRTMAFVRSRRMAELLYVYVRERLKEAAPTLAGRIAPYRGSYLPEDRRRIERDLFEGRLLGLTTTSAMELGIDVGDLDATILTGFPGSLAGTWQQAGRSGRRGQRALTVLLAQDNPLDQYLVRHPEALFGKPIESVRISSTNPHVLKPHLLSAAYEAPLTPSDSDLFGVDVQPLAEQLAQEGLLHGAGGRWHLQAKVEYPAECINIRSASPDTYTLVEAGSGVVLESVPAESAFLQLHPGAVYLHKGEQYLITDLNLDSHTAYAKKTDVPYYTQVMDVTDTRILNVFKSKPAGRATAYLGEVRVSTAVNGFRRRLPVTEEILGEEYIELPVRSYDTVALWFDVPEDTLTRIKDGKMDLAGGLHAAEHAAIGLLPLFAMCDRADIGGISTPLHPDTGRPQVFIHDGTPGGVGIAEHGYDIVEKLWQATLEVISQCRCEAGCPSCVHSPKCGNNNQPLSKPVAVLILKDLLG
ncbi:MAG: DEAD/DEAH box helicase [SAR202 cluster bacterium]|nr:DEAD/DEAH box helicase [SAR202 cluster bacterium]